MSKIKILLVEDHTIVRQGLRSLLEQNSGMEVIGEAENGKEAVHKAENLKPDIVLMDVSMPLLNGIEATRQIKKHWPEIKVLILTMHTTEEYIFQILRAGASGYIVKKAAHQELITAIHAVNRGDKFLSPSISKKVIEEYILKAGETIEQDSFERLTAREREVLQLISEGESNREIAERLFLSVKTVETHKANVMEKLELRTNADLIKYALRKGIICQE